VATRSDLGDGVVKRSVAIAGHRTSVSLEAPFWDALRALAARRGVSVQALVGEIDAGRGAQNLSSAIRVFVLRAAQDAPPTASEPAPPA
jgi:predicted DNA-binding ribbon-helix-helix protein